MTAGKNRTIIAPPYRNEIRDQGVVALLSKRSKVLDLLTLLCIHLGASKDLVWTDISELQSLLPCSISFLIISLIDVTVRY